MTRSDRTRVLYVDGDDETRAAVADCLAGDGIEVVTAEGLAAGVERVEQGSVDAVVATQNLPDGTGLDLLDAVRDRRTDLPFVLYPAGGSEALAAEAVAAGVDGYRPQEPIEESCRQARADVLAAVRERSEERAMLDRMTDAFFALDEDWRFTYLNERGRQVISEAIGREQTVGELRGKHIWEEIPEATGTTFHEKYTEAMKTQEPVAFEEYYEPLGTWFEVRAYPSASGLSVYFKDVTDRRDYEQQLEHRESVLRSMYRIVADKDRSFAEKVDQLFAIGREELGVEYATLSRVDGDDYVFEFVQTPEGDGTIEAGDEVPLSWTSCELAVTTEERLVVNDMAEAPPEVADRTGNEELGLECYLGTPVVVDDGVYGTFCFYGREPREPFSQWQITLVDLMGNWVSYERERQRRREELTRERNRLEEFASVVSHDLRNPLNVALSHLELARDEHESEDLAAVAEALDRMETLIEDVLALARLGRQVVDAEPTDFTALVRTAWGTVADSDAHLVVEGDASAIVGDETRLQQLFENLFRNASEHGGEGVTVRVGPLEDGGGFYVADDGPGIPDGEREEVFERGYTTREDGTGFGLSIVAEIVAAHGGDITVTESEQGGARFEITGIEME